MQPLLILISSETNVSSCPAASSSEAEKIAYAF